MLNVIDDSIAEVADTHSMFGRANGDEVAARCLNEDAISGRQIQDNKINSWH